MLHTFRVRVHTSQNEYIIYKKYKLNEPNIYQHKKNKENNNKKSNLSTDRRKVNSDYC